MFRQTVGYYDQSGTLRHILWDFFCGTICVGQWDTFCGIMCVEQWDPLSGTVVHFECFIGTIGPVERILCVEVGSRGGVIMRGILL